MFLGIDLGTSSVKVMAVSEAGVRKARAGYPPGTSAYEHDAGMVADTVREALQSLFAQGVRAEEILAVGLCGHGPSVVFLDASGEAVTPIVTWQDKRAYREAEQLQAAIPGFTKDGTSYEAKLCWFYRHRPDLFQQGYTALYPKDYLLHLLCPGPVMDSSTASTLAFYDASRCSWDGCDAFFPKEIMPRAVDSWACAGETSTAYAASCGLVPGTPVYPGGIDSFCEAVGAGGFSPDTAVDGSGTSTCLTPPWRGEGPHGQLIPGGLPEHVLPAPNCSSHASGPGFPTSGFFPVHAGGNRRAPGAGRPGAHVPLLYLPYLSVERFRCSTTGLGRLFGPRPDTDRAELLQGCSRRGLRHRPEFRLMGEASARSGRGGREPQPRPGLRQGQRDEPAYEQRRSRTRRRSARRYVAALGSGAYDSRRWSAVQSRGCSSPGRPLPPTRR